MKLAIALASVACLTGAAPALAQHHGHGAHSGHGAHGGRAASRAKAVTRQTPATREYLAAHHKMMRDMNQPYTGDPDADFRIQMIPHHQGALDMARVALRHAKDPWTRQMAESVIVEQQREIYDMQAWLARRGYRAPAGGMPRHVIGWDSYRKQAPAPGTLDESQSSSWAPGSGVPRQR